MTKVKVNLVGGLGNQLSVLAGGWVLAYELGAILECDGWLVPFGSNPTWRVEVDDFDWSNQSNLKVSIVGKSRFASLFRLKSQAIVNRILTNDKSNYINVDRFNNIYSVTESLRAGKRIEGYFSDSFWVLEAFQRGFPFQLTPKHPSEDFKSLEKIIIDRDVIHIRIGDYLNHPEIFPIVSKQYLNQSLNLLKSSSLRPYWIFTDDPDEVTHRFSDITRTAEKY